MLKQIRIRNFQSIEDVTYNFSEGLNVIIAPNNVGKSIINKVIDVLVNFDRLKTSDMVQYITFGKPKSDLFITDEENAYWIEIYPKKINYHLFDGKTFNFVGNQLPSGVIKALGLLLCDGGFIGNLITADHSKLLVDSNSNINNQILSLIARDDGAENILEECEERATVVNSNLRFLRSKRDGLRRELSTIPVEDTFAREEALRRVFSLTQFVEELIGVKELTDYFKPNAPNVDHLKGVIDFCQDLDRVSFMVNNLKEVKEVRNLDKEFRVASELEGVKKKLDDVSYKLDMIKDSKPVSFNLNVIGFVSKLESISANLNKVKVTKKLPEPSMLKSAEELETLFEAFKDYYRKLASLVKLKKEIKSLKEEIDSYGGEVYDCPIYGSIKFVNEECLRNY